jgi:hypothetical protein
VAKRPFANAKISRIFAPQRAQPGVHSVSRNHAAQPYAVAFSKTIPARPVLKRLVTSRANRSANYSDSKTWRPDRLGDKPSPTLPSSNRLVGNLPRPRAGMHLACGVSGLSDLSGEVVWAYAAEEPIRKSAQAE